MNNRVIILMATFNGATFLKQQLDSIRAQTYQEWDLYIRDDGSTDHTLEILADYAALDERIKVLTISGPHGTPALNFGTLFNHVAVFKRNYLMFADQDDVWQPDKIALSLNLMQKQEQSIAHVPSPLLIYSRFQWINEQGNLIEQDLTMPSTLSMEQLLNGNHAYGCTMMLNAALVAKIGKIPPNAYYHDYWVALVACAFGKAVLLPQPLLLYRQHPQNASGNITQRALLSRISRYVGADPAYLKYLRHQFHMTQNFLAAYQKELEPAMLQLIAGYLMAFNKGNKALVHFVFTHGLFKGNLFATGLRFCTILRLRKKIIQ